MSTEEINNPDNESDSTSTEDSNLPEDSTQPAMEQTEHAEKIEQVEEKAEVEVKTEDQENLEDNPQPIEASTESSSADNDQEDAQPEKVETEDQTKQEVQPVKVDTTVTSSVISSVNSADDMSDSASISDADDAVTPKDQSLRNWSNEKSTRAIAIELKHIETDIRKQLEDRDTKRKRKLAGPRRWQELEEDLISWKFNSRVGEDTIRELQRLVARRHYLFTRLRFLASTRPTWNS